MVDAGAAINSEMPDAGSARAAGEGLCTLFVDRLAVTGASISVVGDYGQLTIGASDSVSARGLRQRTHRRGFFQHRVRCGAGGSSAIQRQRQ